MKASIGSSPFDLGPWCIHPDRHEARRDGRLVRLEPMTLQLLLLLIENGDATTTRDQIIDRLWGGRAVTEDAVSKQVSKLRVALADDPRRPWLIQTISKRGFRLLTRPEGLTPRSEPKTAMHAGLKTGLLIVGVCALIGAGWMILRPASGPGPYQQRQATAEAGEEVDPALSPDGRWLAWVARAPGEAGFGLYVRTVDQDGPPRRLTPPSVSARSPAWSANGRLAFILRGADGCRVVTGDALAGDRRVVTRCSQPGGLAWLDENRLIVADHAAIGQALRLTAWDLRTGQARTLTTPPAGVLGDSSPVVSDDGRRLYFIRTVTIGVEEIHQLDIASGRIRRIDGGRARVAGLAPGGRGGLLAASNRETGAPALWRLSPSSGRWTLVANDVKGTVTASRDGRLIALSRSEDRAPLWLASFDGGPGRALTTATVADWSPVVAADGRLAFLSSRSGTRELWIGAPGAAARRLTRFEGPDIQDPAWSPDGRFIALAVPVDGNYDLRLVDVESGAVRSLTTGGSDERHPAFDPSGASLLFSRRSGERYDLMRMTLSTGAVLPVARDVIRALPSPDGRSIWFTRLFRPGLMRLSLPDGRVTRVASWPEWGDLRNWTVAGGRVWGLDRSGDGAPRLMRLDPDTGSVTIAARLPDIAKRSGVAVVEDGVIYSRLTQAEADLFLLRAGRAD